MLSLETLLEHAARSENWDRAVVHRCAWCKRIEMPNGAYAPALPLSTTTVVTDGMCTSCAAKALGRVSVRFAARLAA
jgi:hypothetical protein